MLVNQLRLTVAPQQNAEIVEPGNHTLQLDPVDQEYRDRDLGLAHLIEKRVLQILPIRSHSISCLFFLRTPRIDASFNPDTRPSMSCQRVSFQCKIARPCQSRQTLGLSRAISASVSSRPSTIAAA